MLAQLIEFWSLQEPNVVWVLICSLLLGAAAGSIGCLAFLQKKSLVGDALAHAALPGVATAFLITQSKDPFVIMLGATISSTLGFYTSELLINKTKIKEDSALAIVLSFYFAVGIFLLTIIQKMPSGNQAGLDKILFGQAAALVRHDVIVLSIIACLIICTIILGYRQLKALVFDATFALSIGLPTRCLQFFLSFAIILATITGLQLVGVVLIAALLLTPAAAAKYWTNSLASMLILAATFGAASGIFGTQVSYLYSQMPTGPWIVVALSIIFALSMLFAPARGFIPKLLRQRDNQKRIAEENIIRTIYKLIEQNQATLSHTNISAILAFRSIKKSQLEVILHRLQKSGQIEFVGSAISLTDNGLKTAKTLTRRHRLWEIYLSQKLNLPADHVHNDAEEIEHIITPEIEEALLAEIDIVGQDPHGKHIPHANLGEPHD